MSMRWRTNSTLLGLLLGTGLWWLVTQTNTVTMLHIWMAESLLHNAWVRSQTTGEPHKPWPWATSSPLARLQVPRLTLEKMILTHRSPDDLPYALGHWHNSAVPGTVGNSVLSVPPLFCEQLIPYLQPGDTLLLESLPYGNWRYQVTHIYLVDKTNLDLLQPSIQRRLTLISPDCLSAQKNKRYVIVAAHADSTSKLLSHAQTVRL